jgi:aminoacrylate hydrolase
VLHYETHGEADAPAVVLSSGLGGAGSYWAPQIACLSERFRVVTYDHRGTGKSGGDVPEHGGIAAMAEDLLDLIAHLNLSRPHVVGHALGGLIGLQIALTAPQAIGKLVVVNGWSKVDPHSLRCFRVRLDLLDHAGVPAFVRAQPLFLYPAVWMSENADRLAHDEAHGIMHFQGAETLQRRIAALSDFDIDARLADIPTPTLVMATRDDLLVPYTRSLQLTEGMPNTTLRLTDFGGHAMNVTEPGTFNADLMAFLADD